MATARGTTPTFTLTFPSTGQNVVDLTQARNVYVTFKNGNKTITKTGEDLTVEAHSISVYLNQEETLSFTRFGTEIQANWTYENGRRAASEIKTYSFSEQLLNKVVE